MPKFLEDKLHAEAAAKGLSGRRADRYTYGAMNNMGAMHGNQETAKGARMEAKHEADKAPRSTQYGRHSGTISHQGRKTMRHMGGKAGC